MAEIHWLDAISGPFVTGADWSGGAVPGTSDEAILDAAGGAYAVTSSADQTVLGVQLASNASLDIAGATFTLLDGTDGGANAGSIVVNGGATLAAAGQIENVGAIAVGTSESSLGTLLVQGKTTLSGAGSVMVNGGIIDISDGATLINKHNTIAGQGAIFGGTNGGGILVNKIAGLIEATTLYLNIGSSGFGTMTVVNDGAMAANGSGDGGLYFENCVISGHGQIIADWTTSMEYCPAISGQTISTAVGGDLFMYDDSLTYSGILANAGGMTFSFAGASPNLVVQDAMTLTGGGTVGIEDAATFGGLGATLFNVDNSLIDEGDVNGGHSSANLGEGQLAIVNETAGVIESEASGNLHTTLIIDCGAATLTNAGRIEAFGSAGGVTVDSVVDNSGVIESVKGEVLLQGAVQNTGRLAVFGGGAMTLAGDLDNSGAIQVAKGSMTLEGPVTNDGFLLARGGYLMVAGSVVGDGSAKIANGGNLTFAAGFDQEVVFLDGGGQLTLAQSQSYSATISGFRTSGESGAWVLDLRDIGFVDAQEATFSGTSAGGVLTVSDGAHTAQIHLRGDYLSDKFVASSDFSGGVSIYASSANVGSFVSAAASLTSPCGVAPGSRCEPTTLHGLLVAPASHPLR